MVLGDPGLDVVEAMVGLGDEEQEPDGQDFARAERAFPVRWGREVTVQSGREIEALEHGPQDGQVGHDFDAQQTGFGSVHPSVLPTSPIPENQTEHERTAGNNFTTGRNISVQINTAYGPLLIPASAILNFKANPETTKLRSKGIDGITRNGVIPDSWKGSISIDRLDQTVDNWWAQFEADYYANRRSGTATIIERLQEQDGTVSTWRYEDVALTLDDAGDYAADKKVEQMLSFEASRKVRVS